jgi:chromosomal replication initiator protein
MAQEKVQNILGGREQTVIVELIQKAIADHYKLHVQDLKAKNKSRTVVEPRQIAMYLCRKLTGFSLHRIGREFGNKHHTTVLHSINKIDQLLQENSEVNRLIQTLTESFK